MSVEIALALRPCEGRRNREVRTAVYEEHEATLMRALYARAMQGDASAANEMFAIHELKVAFEGRILPDAEAEKLAPAHFKEPRREADDPRDAPEALQTSMFAPEGTAKFPIPAKARRKMGQVEPDNAPAVTHGKMAAAGEVHELYPDFDGETYVHDRDKHRLVPQLLKVADAMKDGQWHTSETLVAATGENWASISARLRDLRKPKFGGHKVERQHVANGLHEYRLVLNPTTTFPVGYADESVVDDEEAIAH